MLAVLAVLAVPFAASAQSLSRSDTKEMQRALGVRADGVIGPKTRRAIRRFERRNDLRVDGRVDGKLLEALGVDEEEDRTTTGDPSAAVAAAEDAIGTPYASAGTTTDGFDCSGLTMWAFDQAGIDLPHSSYDQYEMGEAVADDEIQAGDLVFFDTAGGGASHVGIATGPDTVISATSSSGVIEHSFVDDGYWADHYIGARRLT